MSQAPSLVRDTLGETELDKLRHSTAHLMAHSVKNLFPEVKLAIGPTIENGFYYDFFLDHAFTPEDLQKIEQEMRKIAAEGHLFERIEMSKEAAKDILKKAGEFLKLDILEQIPDEVVSFYREGEFIDLCRGPHLASTKEIKAFALLSTSSAYWRGDEKREVLQRIYGTAFFKREELEEHLKRLEEAQKRDHRVLGKALGLFAIYEEAGPGLIFWLPKGATLRHTLEEEWLRVHRNAGYSQVYTPHVAKSSLWQISGHLDYYEENMFGGMEREGQEYRVKPMNCPFHILIFRSQRRSYRELPLRLCEFGTVYRYERSGVLHGLLRVRGFTQDDAHIFCLREQIKPEIVACVKLMQTILRKVQMEDVEVELSTKPEKYAGTDEEWADAQRQLREALEETGVSYALDEGGAVFYGPKIDVKIKDSLGRKWQGPTIQLDFNLPRRFHLSAISSSGEKQPVYIIHRAMFGSFERFLGMLIEHFGGLFPLWLAPEQIRICPVSAKHISYAQEIAAKLEQENFRFTVDDRSDTLGYKIRQAEIEKVPYLVIVGGKEAAEATVTVRAKGGKQTRKSLAEWIEEWKAQLKQEMT